MKKIVFIGTSPINLFKGYLMAKDQKNAKIIFIDNYERLGGAWYSDTSNKGHEIECGCHIWSYNPEVYQYFKDELGLNMQEMKPSPVFKYGKTNLSYPLYTIKQSYTYILKNLFNRKNIKAIKDSPEFYWTVFGKKNQYPKEGSPVLIRKMKSLLDELDNTAFHFGKKVEEVHCNEQIQLKGEDFEMSCDQLFMTSVSSIKKLTKANETLELHHNQINYIHLLVELDKAPKKVATYHRLINDPVIHRVTDISYQTNHEEHLYLVGILQDAYDSKSTAELTNYFRKYLLKQNIIDESYETRFVKAHFFPTYYISEEEREAVRQFDERIGLFYSTDIMYGFFYILKEHGLIN